jgi:hypothetical protein
MSNPNSGHPLHQPETELESELQVFSGPALSPDDPSLEPRARIGRPGSQQKPARTDQNERPSQE